MGRPKLSRYYEHVDGKPHFKCRKCQVLKPIEAFPPRKAWGSIYSRCYTCKKQVYHDLPPDKKAAWSSYKGYDPEYYLRSRDTHLARQRKYKDKPEVKERQRKRYREDLQFKLAMNLRGRICVAIKAIAAEKAHSTFDLLGCSLEQFMLIIESQFRPGMTWMNHGRYRVGGPPKWHIDHIFPCALFDLTDPEQQKACFHWSNTQPLWAWENSAKADKI